MVALDKECTVICPKSGKRVDTLLVCQGGGNLPCKYFKDDDGLCLYCSYFSKMVKAAEG